jgi:hypothetical protein
MDFLKLINPEQNKREYKNRLTEVEDELLEIENILKKDKSLSGAYDDRLFDLNLEKQTLIEILHDLSDEPKERLLRSIIWKGNILPPKGISKADYDKSLKRFSEQLCGELILSDSEVVIIGTPLSKVLFDELRRVNKNNDPFALFINSKMTNYGGDKN